MGGDTDGLTPRDVAELHTLELFGDVQAAEAAGLAVDMAVEALLAALGLLPSDEAS